MSIKENTKNSIAETFKILLCRKPLTQITIRDICESCGTTRQTFYYHFKDKYDLIAWIFVKDCKWAFENLSMNDKFFSLQRTKNLLSRMYSNRQFYKKALIDDSQNSLRFFFYAHCMEVIENFYKKNLGVSELGNELQYSILFFCHGCLGCVLDWILKDCYIPIEDFAKILYQNIPDLLLETAERKEGVCIPGAGGWEVEDIEVM